MAARRWTAAVGAALVLAATVGISAVPAAATGGTWTVVPSPNPPPVPNGEINAVSCPTANFCEAVGSAALRPDDFAPLAETWDGTAWTVQTTPTVPGDSLFGVSCVSPSACEAVGGYSNTSQPLSAVAMGWNGAAWSQQPLSSLFSDATLNAVSCTSASGCEAVGARYDNADGLPAAFAAGWNGTAWSAQSLPASVGSLVGGYYSSLNGVSCPAPNFCEAVGSDFGSPVTAIADVWNGSTWSMQPVAAPPVDAATSQLSGVSCVSTTTCEAVGSYTASGRTCSARSGTARRGCSNTCRLPRVSRRAPWPPCRARRRAAATPSGRGVPAPSQTLPSPNPGTG